ncbi:MAG: DsbA family oxidoreductase [Xanthomonadales bacterium]|nr:DsbA family oxidoreductase [Xanthomonadales bacterium]
MNQPVAPTRIRIDFVSDVSCPWCAIGLNALEQALGRLDGELQADIHLQPFELNPQLPPGGEDATEHLIRKYGSSAEQVEANRGVLRERGEAVGFHFDLERRSRVYNTFDAHRLLHWAGLQGRQLPLKHALLKAYFTDGEDVGAHATLVRLAGAVGLDPDRAAEVLAHEEYAGEVRKQEQYYLERGINSVPATIINDQHLISGGQPVEIFERMLRPLAQA